MELEYNTLIWVFFFPPISVRGKCHALSFHHVEELLFNERWRALVTCVYVIGFRKLWVQAKARLQITFFIVYLLYMIVMKNTSLFVSVPWSSDTKNRKKLQRHMLTALLPFFKREKSLALLFLFWNHFNGMIKPKKYHSTSIATHSNLRISFWKLNQNICWCQGKCWCLYI